MDMKPYRPDTPDITWFYSRTRQIGDCLCWINLRTGEPVHSYGQFRIKGVATIATRWIWEQVNGPIPNGLLVCHRCDNPPCVKLDHLFLGTPRDNALDMVRKRRWRDGRPESRPVEFTMTWEEPPKRRTWK